MNPTSGDKVAIVTGSSSGIGYETSLLLARSGFRTYATMRDTRKSQMREIAHREGLPLEIAQLDVSDDWSVQGAIRKIVDEAKRVDVLVNNAGYAFLGAIEDTSMEELKSQFETNLFGAVRVIQQVLPVMRKQSGGTIVNISAVPVGLPFLGAYMGSKFALEGLSESLSYEVEPFGIKVILIEPGGSVKTNAANAMLVAKNALAKGSAYHRVTQMMHSRLKAIVQNGSSPQVVAKVVLDAATAQNPGFRYVVEDLFGLAEARKRSSDSEFRQMMLQNVLPKIYDGRRLGEGQSEL